MRIREIIKENNISVDYESDDEWSFSKDVPFLYHGTSSKFKKNILFMGIGAPSHWGSRQVAYYFAKSSCRDHGGNPIIFKVPAHEFHQSLFSIDDNMIDFCIFNDYDRRAFAFDESNQTWEDCLKIYEAVIYGSPIGVTKNNLL